MVLLQPSAEQRGCIPRCPRMCFVLQRLHVDLHAAVNAPM